ncbi:deoxyguanosinetriphosphate triphosphohydrolase [Desulfocucumis palustris]|uniref:Deoxyguanosinetriphosphate triphosphohydrolase n=2 Tax=Desulfocucumis palustris TaxID=1898651 RepID=A0A2L2XEH4_9FIRM|nr:deoxyguanosinetriphosphate triphosphohydrolase [Desulfocucumis palustris]
MHLATIAYDNVLKKHQVIFPPEQQDWFRQILRLIALTHDLGHPPFSHASEGVLPVGLEHEDFTEKVIKETIIGEYINEIGVIYTKKYGQEYNITPDLICDIYQGRVKDKNLIFLKKFMDSELDVDKMDYLLRDSLYCGVSYGKYDLDRLISSLTIYFQNGPRLAIDKGGMHVTEAFILARYFMFTQVYFHRTRRLYDLMLTNFLKEILPNGTYPDDINEFLSYNDNIVWELMVREKENSEWAQRIIHRDLISIVDESPPHSDDKDKKIYNMIGREIERECGKENIIIDSPSKLPHKIPTRVEVDDEKAIPIIRKISSLPTSLSDESEIIKNLTKPINIIRIYAKKDVYDKAKKIYEERQRDALGL